MTHPYAASVLMCHAPIVIPAVGGGRGAQCAATTRAMREAAAHLARADLDGLVVISPHTPRPAQTFSVVAEGGRDDFAAFSAPGVEVAWTVPDDVVGALVDAGGVGLAGDKLDHGAFVPLWFAQQAGVDVPTVVVGLSAHTTRADNLALGATLARACAPAGGRWGLLASGDMSHRLSPAAPGGHDPAGARFDRAVCDVVDARALDAVADIDPAVRDAAGEDVVDSLEVASGALGRPATLPGCRRLSYEGPFGVGYLVAVLDGPRQEETDDRR